MQWEEIEDEAIVFLNSSEFNTGGKMYPYLLKWGNDVQNKVAMKIDLRYHHQDCTLTVTTSDTSVAVPDIFLKKDKRFTKFRVDDEYIVETTKEKLEAFDPDHNETTDNAKPGYIALEGKRLYFYPLWAGDLVMEDYIRKPSVMTERNSEVDLPDDNGILIKDLILAGVLEKAFLWLQDFDMTVYYKNEFRELLDEYEVNVKHSNSDEVKEKKYY